MALVFLLVTGVSAWWSEHENVAILAFSGVLSLAMLGLASLIVRRDFAKRRQAEVERELFFTVPLHYWHRRLS